MKISNFVCDFSSELRRREYNRRVYQSGGALVKIARDSPAHRKIRMALWRVFTPSSGRLTSNEWESDKTPDSFSLHVAIQTIANKEPPRIPLPDAAIITHRVAEWEEDDRWYDHATGNSIID